MLLLVSAVLLIAVTVAFTLFVRAKDMPPPEPVSPVRHLEDRRAAIYENLRDLQFEYRVGKLSDADYQQTKLGLQKELAGVLAEMERLGGGKTRSQKSEVRSQKPEERTPEPEAGTACPHCGARFETAMKFCGECGKAMA
jgi:hypothetical protein